MAATNASVNKRMQELIQQHGLGACKKFLEESRSQAGKHASQQQKPLPTLTAKLSSGCRKRGQWRLNGPVTTLKFLEEMAQKDEAVLRLWVDYEFPSDVLLQAMMRMFEEKGNSATRWGTLNVSQQGEAMQSLLRCESIQIFKEVALSTCTRQPVEGQITAPIPSALQAETAQSLGVLMTRPHLERLTLRKLALETNSSAWELFCQGLADPACRLETLHFDGLVWDRVALQHLGEALARNSSLRTINFHQCLFGSEEDTAQAANDFGLLCNGWRQSRHLQRLEFQSCRNLNDDLGCVLAHSLIGNETVTHLALPGCQVGRQTLNGLAQALAHASCYLAHMDLSKQRPTLPTDSENNGADGTGARVVRMILNDPQGGRLTGLEDLVERGLNHNTSLRCLDVSENGLGDQQPSLQLLLRFIFSSRSSLERLVLSFNHVEQLDFLRHEDGAEESNSTLTPKCEFWNTRLRKLDLFVNPLSYLDPLTPSQFLPRQAGLMRILQHCPLLCLGGIHLAKRSVGPSTSAVTADCIAKSNVLSTGMDFNWAGRSLLLRSHEEPASLWPTVLARIAKDLSTTRKQPAAAVERKTTALYQMVQGLAQGGLLGAQPPSASCLLPKRPIPVKTDKRPVKRQRAGVTISE